MDDNGVTHIFERPASLNGSNALHSVRRQTYFLVQGAQLPVLWCC